MNYLGELQPTSVLPPFDFMDLTCSTNNRQKLAKIYKAVQSADSAEATKRRIRFLNMLTTSAYDPNRGVYTPLSDSIYPTGKLKDPLEPYPAFTPPLTRHFYTYFTNPLLIPAGYGEPGFDLSKAEPPIDRLTNAGWMVVTMEFDWEDVGQFDRNLRWFSGKNGDFGSAPFAELDTALGRHRDYRGFCAVYSGRRSVHMHFLYDTTHLLNAPFDADRQTRNDADWRRLR